MTFGRPPNDDKSRILYPVAYLADSPQIGKSTDQRTLSGGVTGDVACLPTAIRCRPRMAPYETSSPGLSGTWYLAQFDPSGLETHMPPDDVPPGPSPSSRTAPRTPSEAIGTTCWSAKGFVWSVQCCPSGDVNKTLRWPNQFVTTTKPPSTGTALMGALTDFSFVQSLPSRDNQIEPVTRPDFDIGVPMSRLWPPTTSKSGGTPRHSHCVPSVELHTAEPVAAIAPLSGQKRVIPGQVPPAQRLSENAAWSLRDVQFVPSG